MPRSSDNDSREGTSPNSLNECEREISFVEHLGERIIENRDPAVEMILSGFYSPYFCYGP